MANANNAPVGLKLNYSPAELELTLNLGGANVQPQMQHGSLLIRRAHRVFKGVYNFAVQGGALGNINLYDSIYAPGTSAMPGLGGISGSTGNQFKPLILPYGLIVSRVLIDVITQPTSGGSPTIAWSTGVTAADVKAATAISSLTVGLYDGLPANTAATSIKVQQIVTGVQGVIPFITVATAALTGGKFNVHFEGYLSD